jgi:hypothetical protein
MIWQWIAYAIVGRILIFVWQKFPDKYVPTQFIKSIHACDLCSGVYIYVALAFVAGNGFILSFIVGCITSFVVWIFVKGFKSAFLPDVIHLG